MMVHANSDPVSSSDQLQNSLKSAITTSPPSMSLSHHDCSTNQIHRPHELYSENYVHPPPLENRNSAPEIVVLSPGRELPKIPIQSSQQDSNQVITKNSRQALAKISHRVLSKSSQVVDRRSHQVLFKSSQVVARSSHQVLSKSSHQAHANCLQEVAKKL